MQLLRLRKYVYYKDSLFFLMNTKVILLTLSGLWASIYFRNLMNFQGWSRLHVYSPFIKKKKKYVYSPYLIIKIFFFDR